MNLFKSILADQKSIPRDPPYKDLVRLINFILRQFFKAIEENTFLAVEVSDIQYVIHNFHVLNLSRGLVPEEPWSLETIFQLGANPTVER